MFEAAPRGGGGDPALELIEKYRAILGRGDTFPEQNVDERGYVPILLEELALHGHPLRLCSAAYRWYRYRRSLKALLRRLARSRGAPRDYRDQVTRELRLTMAVLAGYYYTCGSYYKRKADAEGKTWQLNLYAEMRECASLLHRYMGKCLEYRDKGARIVEECWRARIQSLLEGANPQLILAIMKKY